MPLPKFSVITPSYNQGQYIRQTIESVLMQNYPCFEHIVIDGGSTDNTLEVLKSFPHLIWSSEPDEGQSSALNKGFARASGDIIAWINSDDWYPPGIFETVAAELQQHPLVMGVCELIDDNGKLIYQVGNFERSWFDLLRYWVPYSIPTQPAIFFRRSVLEELRRPDGSYLDQSLYYLMDYDLWMRMALKYPFAHRVHRTFAYYRMTENNKTSHRVKSMPYAEPEMSLIFHRYLRDVDRAGHKCSFIIPAREAGADLKNTLETLMLQSLRDFEVIVADYSGSRQIQDGLSRMLQEYNEQQRSRSGHNYFRWLAVSCRTAAGAFHEAAGQAGGEILLALEPGSLAASDLLLNTVNLFANDNIGLALPFASNHALGRHFPENESQGDAQIAPIFSAPPMPWSFAVRKVALIELNGIRARGFTDLALRQLILRILQRGWRVSFHNHLAISSAQADPQRSAALDLLVNYVNAKLIDDLAAEVRSDPFAAHRASFGWGISLPEELAAGSARLLAAAPSAWENLDWIDDPQRLEAMARDYPDFSPAWFYLAKHHAGQNSLEAARRAKDCFERARERELGC